MNVPATAFGLHPSPVLLFCHEQKQEGGSPCKVESAVVRHIYLTDLAIVVVRNHPILIHLADFAIAVVRDYPIFTHIPYVATITINNRSLLTDITDLATVV